MRLLMLPMRFPLESGESYLTTELADALVADGHKVSVLQLAWDGEPGRATEELVSNAGVRVVRIYPRCVGWAGSLVRRASKFWLSSRHVGREAERTLDLAQFDALVSWMPAIAFAPVVRRAARKVPHRLLFIWDFFPDHHAEIGRIPKGPAAWLARAWENNLLKTFTTIFCTLPGNARYLRDHYRLETSQQVYVAPIWTALEPIPAVGRAAVRERHGLPKRGPIAVFGGQLSAGRGLDQMLDSAALAEELTFLFVGDGALATEVDRRARTAPNIRRLPAMRSAQYRELLQACDVGMVATVPGLNSFATPSKTLDYLKASLPVVAALEPGNEFGSLLEQWQVGKVVPFGDASGFAGEALFLATDRAFHTRLSQRTYSCLVDNFDVRLTVAKILDAIRERPGTRRMIRTTTQKPAWVAR
jgi:glycosyltransferase involved in cell wall biosynthesis